MGYESGLKVALIANSFPKLSETFILSEAIELKKQGVNLDIIALNKTPDSIKHDEYSSQNLESNLKVLSNYDNLKHYKKVLLVCFLLFKCLFLKPQILAYFFSKGFSAQRMRALVYISGLGYQVHNYDVIYCHFGNNALLIDELLESGFLKGKLAVVFHGFDISSFLQKSGNSIYENIFKKIDYFLPISLHWKEKLISMGVAEDKIFIHRMGINLAKFKYQEKTKNTPVNFISVCRLTEKKGIVYAVQALHKLSERLDFNYYIIGSGQDKHEIESYIKKYGLADKIHLLGAQSQERVIEQLEASHVLLAPSVTGKDGSKEGIPVVIMEAMAQGNIVISTIHSGIPELVKDNENGFLAVERDVESLVAKIDEAVNSDWPKISKKALDAVKAEFVTTIAIEKLLTLFKR